MTQNDASATCPTCGNPDEMCWCGYEEPPVQRPSIEAECASGGHDFYGVDHPDAPDGMGGRCYCGARRYPVGGSK